MKNKDRILIFIGGYLPSKKYGGPVTSIVNFAENMMQYYDVYIVASNHDFKETTPLKGIKEGWNEVNKAHVMYIPESQYKTKVFNKIIKEINPVVLYLSSIFHYNLNLPAIFAAKKNNVPIILAPRGELCHSALELGKTKKKIYLNLINLSGLFKKIHFQATSTEEKEAIVNILKKKEEDISLLPNMPCKIKPAVKHDKKPGLASFVFLGRIHRIKNVKYAIERLCEVKKEAFFDIYGPVEDKEYWEECERCINNAPPNIKISYKGILNAEEVKEAFGKYDCLIFPTLNENFGHVVAEAVSVNCHVLISRGTTPWDDIDNRGGFAIDLRDENGWKNKIEEIIDMDSEAFKKLDNKLEQYANEKLNNTDIINGYLNMFDRVVNGKKGGKDCELV